MSLREYRPLTRDADVATAGELRITYYIVCEGQNTEWIYFKWMSEFKKKIGIQNSIMIVPLEKTDKHQSWSHPKKLFQLAETKREELKLDENSTYSEVDKFVIVFDVDIYNGTSKDEFADLLSNTKKDEIVIATNPCFELWLLLHMANAYAQHIEGDELNMLSNCKVSNKHTYTSKKISHILGFNTKGNFQCNALLEQVDTAIAGEKNLCEDTSKMVDTLGCNMGLFISELRKQKFEKSSN